MNSRFRYLLVPLFALVLASTMQAQTASISGEVLTRGDDPGPVVGATIRIAGERRGAIADRRGAFRISGLAPGSYTLSFNSLGHERIDTTVSVGAGDSLFLLIELAELARETEDIVVTGTRTQRTISDVPVRVEAVPQEEVEEKLLMAPANVSMLLNESTGMRVQTTSPTTSTANLRIQGLPGRYTQVLTDGIPNVGGLAAGSGLTELPPLNLRQVEIVKGAASALYGADAISGVVNFITKDARREPELTALVNVTTQKGIDLAAFGGRMFGDVGVTLMASRNTQPRFDVDEDGFADIPETERNTIYPKMSMAIAEDVQLDVALGFISDQRLGGAMSGQQRPGGSDAPYVESVSSRRFSGTTQLTWEATDSQSLLVKAAAMNLTRDSWHGTHRFNAAQQVAYAEVQYSAIAGSHGVVIAGVFSADDFADRTGGALDRSYRYVAPALLAQEEFRITDRWTALASGRVDFHNRFGTSFTPRFSLMFRPEENVTVRLGGGTGFKAPTIFIEEVEELGFADVILAADVTVERAQSASFDVNWNTVFGEEIGVSLNAAAYATRVQHALKLWRPPLSHDPWLEVDNADGDLFTRGAELSTKVNYGEMKLSLGYTYLYATQTDLGTTKEIALNPRHSFGAVLMWESEEAGAKVGFETYFTGRQRLEDHPTRESSPSYWIAGLLVEKAFGPVRLFVNFENVTDTRQTRFESLIIGNPATERVQALPVYAPLEGRVINGGVRLVL